MSLSSTPTLKAWLSTHLGPILSPKYFNALSDFFNARISRDEFSDAIHNVFQESLAQQYRAQQEQATNTQTPTEAPSQSTDQSSQPSQAQTVPQIPPPLPHASTSGSTLAPTQTTSAPSQTAAPQQIQSQNSQSSPPPLSTSTSLPQPTAQSAAAASAASDRLIQVHNALIISLFDATTHHRRSGLLGAFQHSHAQNQAALAARGTGDGSDMDGSGGAAGQQRRRRKRRRLGYGYEYAQVDGEQSQDQESEDDGMWSDRLRRWVVGMGRSERERLKSLAMINPAAASGAESEGTSTGIEPTTMAPPPPETDEINMERAVVYLSERGDPPGLRRPMSLSVLTRAPTVQHIADRVNLISAQHDLAAPSKDVASLLLLALEAKIKQLVTHALTLTQSGLSIQSIPATSAGGVSSRRYAASGAPTGGGSGGGVLSIDALDTLFTISPSDLPQRSAAVMARLALGDDRGDEEDGADLLLIRDREVSDQRWQVMALLAERSAVRESLQTRPRS